MESVLSPDNVGTMAAKRKFLLLASIVFGIDLLSKHLVSTLPGLQGCTLVPHFVNISLVVNSGIFFRLFDDVHWVWKPHILAGLSLAPVLVIVWWRMKLSSGREPLQTALALIAGGLLGNSADRILYGAVFDFIEVHFEDSVYYPTFNLADLAITVGLIVILADFSLSLARTHRRPKPVP